ncbi:hypothetical protein BGZ46_006508 [Entomortierella lignicola]|nr:hypothetical protein BGZ46_006508 [Entomortierella lignicola]
MAITATVFEIPILLDVICDNLSPKDIWNCYRSCRAWKSLFDPYRSRIVQYAYLNSTQTSSIIQNSHQIRILKVDLADAGYFLNSACINLRKLFVVDFEYTNDKSTNPNTNALELIKRNPKLQKLDIHHRADTQAPQPFHESVLESLSIHASLRSITINMRLPWDVTRSFLSHLPPKLEELTMMTYYYVSQHSDPANRLLPLQLDRPTALRRITMLDEMSSPQHYFLPSLLTYCPDLEEISVPHYSEGCREIAAILKANCPKLRVLNQGAYISPFFECEMRQLINTAFPNGLQRLVLGKMVKHSRDRQNRFLDFLANSPSVNTLEVLEMERPKSKSRSTLQLRTAQLVRQLFDKLQAIKNLKCLNLNWKSSSFQGEAMPLEIGLAYVNDNFALDTSGLINKMTKADISWMGLHWNSLDDIRHEKESRKLEQAAARTGVFENGALFENEVRSIYQSKEKYQDWPLLVDQKRFGKSGHMLERQLSKS